MSDGYDGGGDVEIAFTSRTSLRLANLPPQRRICIVSLLVFMYLTFPSLCGRCTPLLLNSHLSPLSTPGTSQPESISIIISCESCVFHTNAPGRKSLRYVSECLCAWTGLNCHSLTVPEPTAIFHPLPEVENPKALAL